ncbi:MAG: hypothetical protein JO216_06465 [Hyphomicrobiales bacterium]|nr:hypothetical protein [Hyphomicrobiales bacterium]
MRKERHHPSLCAAALALALILPRAGAHADPSAPFHGVWEACQSGKGEPACHYFILEQKEERICGLWHYSADARDFEGRLIAETQGLSGRVTYNCGTPGAETSIACSGQAVPFAPSEWMKTDRPLLICAGRIFELGARDRSCADIGKSAGLPKLSSFTQPISGRDREWMNACLNDPTYPPPKLRR